MKLLTFKSQIPYGSNTYIFENNSDGILVDPSVAVNDVLEVKNIKIKYIVLTHAHFDHMLSLNEWQSATNAPVFIGKADAAALSDSYLNCSKGFLNFDILFTPKPELLFDGDRLILGDEHISVIETPGHTSGSIALYSAPDLLVGDTVFAGGGIGRTDLPSGSYKQLLDSIKKIKSFPRGTLIHPGHGETFSI